MEVDLATGTAPSVAGVLPGTTSPQAEVQRVVRSGHRMIVSTSIAQGQPDGATYASYALDRATRSWRDLHVASFNPSHTRDLGVVVEGRRRIPTRRAS